MTSYPKLQVFTSQWQFCQRRECFSSPTTSRPPLGPTPPSTNGYWGGSFLWGVKLIIHLHLVPKFRTHGAILPFPHMSSQYGVWLSMGCVFMHGTLLSTGATLPLPKTSLLPTTSKILSNTFLSRLTPYRWRQHGLPKHWYPTMSLYCITTQKTTTWIIQSYCYALVKVMVFERLWKTFMKASSSVFSKIL